MNKLLREAALQAKQLAELAAEGKAEAGVGLLAWALGVVIEEVRELGGRVADIEEERE
jgi:hypothetical protein